MARRSVLDSQALRFLGHPSNSVTVGNSLPKILGKERVGSKPGSVLISLLTHEGGYLSGMFVTKHL